MSAPPTHAERLLCRLDDLGSVLAERGDAIALIALGSVGMDHEHLDDHSDLDFFVVVEDAAKPKYLAAIDWLEAVGEIDFSFANTIDGRKVLFADGLFAEYAVFTLDELREASYPPARLVWRREDAPLDLERPRRAPGPSALETPEWQVNEALTNLYVGLHRELRGERLAAMRLIQVHAVNRLLAYVDLTGLATGPRRDPFAIERGAEARLLSGVLQLEQLTLGYERNREAALAVLAWLETHASPSPVLVAAIRELAA
jgi:hypothetical protein